MGDNMGSGRVRCYQLIRLGGGRPARCHLLVTWHGLFQADDGSTYRVFACDDHAEKLDDRLPFTARLRLDGRSTTSVSS